MEDQDDPDTVHEDFDVVVQRGERGYGLGIDMQGSMEHVFISSMASDSFGHQYATLSPAFLNTYAHPRTATSLHRARSYPRFAVHLHRAGLQVGDQITKMEGEVSGCDQPAA